MIALVFVMSSCIAVLVLLLVATQVARIKRSKQQIREPSPGEVDPYMPETPVAESLFMNARPRERFSCFRTHMADDPVWTLVVPCLAFLRSHATTIQSNDLLRVTEFIAQLEVRGHVARTEDPHVVAGALENLLSRCSRPLFPSTLSMSAIDLGPPHLKLLALTVAVVDSQHGVEKLKSALHAIPLLQRSRILLVLQALYDIWTKAKASLSEAADRFAPLLFRDHRFDFSPAQTQAATRSLALALQHASFLSCEQSDLALVDQLVDATVRAVLFESPKITNQTNVAPKPSNLSEVPVTRIQALARGWLCRRWLGITVLYDTEQRSGRSRIGYLALTKQVLNWSVEKVADEKREVKCRLREFDAAFELKHGRRPQPKEKESMRKLYQVYHFLNLILDYQRTLTDRGPVTEVGSDVMKKKVQLQLRLILFEHHFQICTGDKVQNRDDYGHMISYYVQYKELKARLDQTNQSSLGPQELPAKSFAVPETN
ncbi:hypothetical protein AeRB84_000707 [Aphanomyces euteiches]|nr:hypothetical protein AeRB84_000707 [Aphanomyces euteiches]